MLSRRGGVGLGTAGDFWRIGADHGKGGDGRLGATVRWSVTAGDPRISTRMDLITETNLCDRRGRVPGLLSCRRTHADAAAARFLYPGGGIMTLKLPSMVLNGFSRTRGPSPFSRRRAGGRYRRQPREPGTFFLRKRHHGYTGDRVRPAARSEKLWLSVRPAPTRNSPRCRFAKRRFGTATRRRPTRLTASPRRLCWSSARRTANSTG